MNDVNFDITKKQQFFLESTCDETLYGGAAGGGKSYGQLIDAFLSAVRYPKSRQLVLRRTFPELQRSLILVSLMIYPKDVAAYKDNKHIWMFFNGSIIEFGYCDSEKDVTNYQSAEYDIIRFDELTHFTEFQYTYLISRIRGANSYPKQIKSTTNPGGVGHGWVKKRFIDNKEPFKIYQDEFERTYVFIPAKVQENKFLMDADPLYIKRLQQLPENERKALLGGDWDIFEGQVFTEWSKDTHVITPRMPKRSYLCYRSLDWGYAKPFSVGWWYLDEDGNAVRYKEYYGCSGKPDEGVKLDPYTVGLKIAQMEKEEKNQIVYGIADSACWSTDDGSAPIIKLINDALLENDCVPFLKQADKRKGSRVAGKMQIHYRLKNSSKSASNGLYVCENCTDSIRTIPMLIYDDDNVEDVDTSMEDHAYDEWRYFLDSKPISSDAIGDKPKQIDDDDDEDGKEGSVFD